MPGRSSFGDYLPETSSSTSRNCSLPKNISLPTKKVGEPKAPRSTAACVFKISFALTSLLRTRKQFGGVEAGRRQGFDRHFGVVHLLGLDPHVMERGVDIFLEHTLELGGDGGAHQIEGVDRKERIPD